MMGAWSSGSLREKIVGPDAATRTAEPTCIPQSSGTGNPLRKYFDAVFGDTTGTAHLAVGTRPYLNGNGKYAFMSWRQETYAWPDDADRLKRDIARAATDSDVYLCPYLMRGDKRTPGAVVTLCLLHVDVDSGVVDLDRVCELDGFAVGSGSPGNAHVYIPLSKPVTIQQHCVLERALQNRLGADKAKIRPNDVLRPPGTFNHKPVVSTPGSDPAAVEFLIEPSGRRADPYAVAKLLSVDLADIGSASAVSVPTAWTGEPVDLDAYVTVKAAVKQLSSPPDRSKDTMRIVTACHTAGMTLMQTRTVVAGRPDLAGRLSERHDDDVLNCWLKAVDAGQQSRDYPSLNGFKFHAEGGSDEATTWEPHDLDPWLRGEVQQPELSIGVWRSDGLQLLYPGREHAVLGETESGKTWFALMCVAAELNLGRTIVYIHYEESDPASTIERLRLLRVPEILIAERLRFVAPSRPVCDEWITPLLEPTPTLVVHDGVNEAMALHGADIMTAEGASLFRRQVVTPFLKRGTTVLSCDHLAKITDGRSAYGSVHKGNALDGARFVMERTAPFGRHLRGTSSVFVTKDRPGQLRAHGKPSKVPGKTFIGSLVVDDSQTSGPGFVPALYAPKPDEQTPQSDPAVLGLADTVYGVIAALPGRRVESQRRLFAELREAKVAFRQSKVLDAIEDLMVTGRLKEVAGKRGAHGYQTVVTAAQTNTQDCTASTATTTAALIGRRHSTAVAEQPQPTDSAAMGSGGPQSSKPTQTRTSEKKFNTEGD